MNMRKILVETTTFVAALALTALIGGAAFKCALSVIDKVFGLSFEISLFDAWSLVLAARFVIGSTTAKLNLKSKE